MNLSPLPKLAFLDNNGRPLVGGLLFTYVVGTSTKQVTYTDEAGGTPNSNPVVLDFRGEANVWLDPELTYKFVLAPRGDTDPPTRPIWTVDNILGINAGTVDWTRIYYDRTPAEVLAGVVPVNYYYPPGQLLRYGTNTIPGTTDMTAALQAAIDVLGGDGGTVIAPAGVYAFDDSVSLAELYGIRILGEGRSPTIHNQGTVFVYTGTGDRFIDARSSIQCTLESLRIVHSSGSFTGYLVDTSHSIARDTSGFCAENVHFGSYNGLLHSGFGINLDKAISSRLIHCSFDALDAAVDGQDPAGGSYSNVIELQACTFLETASVPVRYCGEAWSFRSCTFEPRQGGIAGAILTTVDTPVKGIGIDDCWFGDLTGGTSTWVTLFGSGAVVSASRFGGTAGGKAFSLNGFSGFKSEGNTFILFDTVYNFDTATCSGFNEESNTYDTCTNIFGSVANQDSFAIGTTGFTILPNQKLWQWGRSTVAAGTPLAVTLPKAFTAADYAITLGLYAPATASNTPYATSIGTTGFTLNVDGSGSNTVHWTATGDA